VRQLPNLLTLLRLLLTLPIGWLLLQGDYLPALLLFGVAGASDALDGFLARHFGWSSRIGSILDPLADKLLLVTSYICLSLSGVLPLWLAAVVLGRDLLIVLGAAVYRWRRGSLAISPSVLGKLSTLLQISLVLTLLLELSLAAALAPLRAVLVWLVLLITVASGADYVRTWLGRYLAQQGA
jgi:cardiolipin synthase